jgi:hypothetical protein
MQDAKGAASQTRHCRQPEQLHRAEFESDLRNAHHDTAHHEP